MTDREAVGRALVAKCIADHIKHYIDETKDEVVVDMKPGDRVTYAHNDIAYGSITMTNGRRGAHLVDPDAFLAWVERAYPDRIIRQVDPAFLGRILNVATRLGVAVDTETGEVIPGIEITQGEPFPSLRPTTELKELVQERMLGLTKQVIEGPR